MEVYLLEERVSDKAHRQRSWVDMSVKAQNLVSVRVFDDKRNVFIELRPNSQEKMTTSLEELKETTIITRHL